MDRPLKAALLAIGCLIGVPVSAFLIWDAVAFRPHIAEINRILNEADHQDRELTPTIHRLLRANLANGPAYLGSTLCLQLDPKPGNRHVTRSLWGLSVRLHFNADERDALLAALAWNGTDYGLDRQALRTYGRPLSNLSDREAAMVVAWTYGPRYYRNNPERLQARADALLRQSRGL